MEMLLAVDVEVDVDLGLRWFRVGGEAPVLDGVLGRRCQKRVAGFDFSVGDGAVGVDGDEKHYFAAHAHTAGEFWIDGRDAGDDGTMNVDGMGRAGAERQAA